MSLKAFHIAFIAVSTLLALGFGLWAANSYASSRELLDLLLAGGSFAGGGLLVLYSRWFIRKLKHLSYL
jgi:hypothetical protein